MADVVGTGWKFPFQFDANGKVASTVDLPDGSTSQQGTVDHLFGALYQLIMTARGERLIRGTLGCGIHDFVFEPNDETLVGLVLFYVTDVVLEWEPRIEVLDIESIQEGGKLRVIITFQIKSTREVGNVVVPVIGE